MVAENPTELGIFFSLTHFNFQVEIAAEFGFGFRKAFKATQLLRSNLFFWYDYFSCPQNTESSQALKAAITSIPVYISECTLFFALCPTIESLEKSEVLTLLSWHERGWCRLEQSAFELATQSQDLLQRGHVVLNRFMLIQV